MVGLLKKIFELGKKDVKYLERKVDEIIVLVDEIVVFLDDVLCEKIVEFKECV